jgi:hypothetical protein
MSINADEFDDYHIDDISKNKPKKKVNGKKKGNRTELDLTKILTERFKSPFSRTVGSGSRWSQATLPQHAKEVFSGDLIVPKGFKFAIESKGGYDSIDIGSIFLTGNKELETFFDQATEDAKRCNRKPMLCWKRTRKPWIAFVIKEEIKNIEFKYAITYGKWTGIALEHLLKLEDDFFIDKEN